MTEQSSQQIERPPLPEPYGMVGLFIGFVLAGVYYLSVIAVVPNGLFPIHLVVLVPVVPIFLGVPVLMEKAYWRRCDV